MSGQDTKNALEGGRIGGEQKIERNVQRKRRGERERERERVGKKERERDR